MKINFCIVNSISIQLTIVIITLYRTFKHNASYFEDTCAPDPKNLEKYLRKNKNSSDHKFFFFLLHTTFAIIIKGKE